MIIPTIKDLYDVCQSVKKEISDEYRAFEFDEIPGIQLTIGADETGWNYQTGDNSYSGPVYSFPYWAVVGVYKNSNCMDLAIEIQNQLIDIMPE